VALRRGADGAVEGEVLPSWRPLLFGPDGLRLEQWLRDGQARLVKHGPQRSVYRVDAAQTSFFVKHYRCRRWWQALAHWFRASPSRREFRRARETLRRRVPTAEPLAWIDSRRGALVYDNFLVTRAIGGSCTLEECIHTCLPRLPSAEAARLRRKLTLSLARLCAAAHLQGIDHNDLHLGNVLLCLDTCHTAADDDRLPELSLIDLPGVRLSRPLNRRRTVAALAMLGSACAELATKSDLWRFWRAYVAQRPELREEHKLARVRERFRKGVAKLCRERTPCRSARTERTPCRSATPNNHRSEFGGTARSPFPTESCPGAAQTRFCTQLARRIAASIPHRRRRVARSRDRRALKTNRDFYDCRNGRSRAWAVSDFAREQLTRLLEEPGQLLTGNLHRVFKLSHRSVVVQAELPLATAEASVAYKRVRPRNWWKTLLHYFRRNPALEAWHYGHALLLRGIATARPLAVVERPRWGLPAEGYLATQWIEGANNLHVYAWQLTRRSEAERRGRTRQVAESLGRLLGRMHAWHVSHRDLKGCNILLVERDDSVECYLIDADSVRLPRRLSPFFRAFNLARLATSLEAHSWVTRADRLRFLRAYLGELHRRDPGAWPADWKRAWRAVAKATRRIIGRLKRGDREIV
ncbi:MAG: hypothetical protein B7Z73_11505, partial [Planctomycetia bacterium 21-64-5]